MATSADDALSDDLLSGAAEVAQFLFGNQGERRRVYHLTAKGELPCFHMGGTLYARKSTLLAWISQREHASASAA